MKAETLKDIPLSPSLPLSTARPRRRLGCRRHAVVSQEHHPYPLYAPHSGVEFSKTIASNMGSLCRTNLPSHLS